MDLSKHRSGVVEEHPSRINVSGQWETMEISVLCDFISHVKKSESVTHSILSYSLGSHGL